MVLRQRQPRIKDPAFLAFVRTLPCTTCGKPGPSQSAHIRYSDFANGNLNPGVGAKSDDAKAVPMCPRCHLYTQHTMGERAFWEAHRIDPFAVAQRLYKMFEGSRKAR